ncbi:MAG: glycosyltransferase [Candidatus Paceibacterota bacterium]
MKLLIITQKMDTQDPVLGFFVRWVEELAKHAESVHVIALEVGEHNLPENVTVHSLGKEKEKKEQSIIHNSKFIILAKLKYVWTFYRYIFQLRKEYDAVFVHMNPEYIVLGGLLWRLWNKTIGLWYNHTVGSMWLKIAQPFTNYVFHTSPFAYTARYKNAHRMPAGIDTEVFKPHPEVEKIPKSIYFQGRVAPAKRVHIIIEAFSELYQNGEANLLTLVGPEDENYTKPLKEKFRSLIEEEALVFKGVVPNSKTPELYTSHSVSVNLTDDGNYDKTVLESLACGTSVITSSRAFSDAPVVQIEKPTVKDFIEGYRHTRSENQEDMVKYVKENHSLESLGEKIFKIYVEK